MRAAMNEKPDQSSRKNPAKMDNQSLTHRLDVPSDPPSKHSLERPLGGAELRPRVHGKVGHSPTRQFSSPILSFWDQTPPVSEEVTRRRSTFQHNEVCGLCRPNCGGRAGCILLGEHNIPPRRRQHPATEKFISSGAQCQPGRPRLRNRTFIPAGDEETALLLLLPFSYCERCCVARPFPPFR